MVTGLLYSEENREAMALFMKDATVDQLRRLMERGARRGLAEEGIYPFCLELFRLAERGLLERSYQETSKNGALRNDWSGSAESG